MLFESKMVSLCWYKSRKARNLYLLITFFLVTSKMCFWYVEVSQCSACGKKSTVVRLDLGAFIFAGLNFGLNFFKLLSFIWSNPNAVVIISLLNLRPVKQSFREQPYFVLILQLFIGAALYIWRRYKWMSQRDACLLCHRKEVVLSFSILRKFYRFVYFFCKNSTTFILFLWRSERIQIRSSLLLFFQSGIF